MKENKQQQQNMNKDQLSKSNLLEPLLTVSLAQSYVSLQKSQIQMQKSPLSLYEKDRVADSKQNQLNKLNQNDNTTTKSNQKGKLRFGRDSMLKNQVVELPQIKGSQPLNPIDILHINSVSQPRYISKSAKMSDIQKQQLDQSKPNDYHTNIYKQKVLKQNQAIKRKLYENASSTQSSYIPLSSKVQEREIQINSQSLLIMGSSNNKKLPAIQELQKSTNSSQITLTPLKLVSKQNQQNKSANNLNQKSIKSNNNYSQPMNINLQNENNLNNKSIQNTSIDSNNLNFRRESLNNESIVINSISQRFSKDLNISQDLNAIKDLKQNKDINTPNSLNNDKNTSQNLNLIKGIITPKNINNNANLNINIITSTAYQSQSQSRISQEFEENILSQQNGENIILQNKIQKYDTNKSIQSEDEEDYEEESQDRTVQKGQKQKNIVNSLTKQQSKEVKFNVKQSVNIQSLQKISNIKENGQKSTLNIDFSAKIGEVKKSQNSKQSFEELNGVLNNKKVESVLVQINELGGLQKQKENEIASYPQIHQVLSRKNTQNKDLTKNMEVSTFQSYKKLLVEDNNDDVNFEEDGDDSFAQEERENEYIDKENDDENTPNYFFDEQNPNDDSVQDDEGEDEQTICFKQQMQQQLNQKHQSKEIMKTLAHNQLKTQGQQLTQIKESTYKSRLETIKLNYSQQDSKIIVIHNKTDFQIEIFSDDSGGGKYDWKINDVMLGAGSQGRVYKAFCSKQVKNFALKMVYLDDFENEYAKDVIYEILILKYLRGNSPFLQLYDVFGLQQQNQKTIVMVMEYCQCNLLEIINLRQNEKRYWSEIELMYIYKQMLDGIKHLNDKSICHRDLKVQNILFSAKDLKHKIGDFSEGKFLSLNSKNSKAADKEKADGNIMEHSFRGTWKYLSPELSHALGKLQDICQYDPYLSDLYSLGVMFADMMSLDEIKFMTKSQSGDRSINNSNYMTQLKAYLTANVQKNINTKACQLILCLLNEVPQNRIDFQGILKSYEIENDLTQVTLEQDKEISLEIESRRENSKIMSQYQKAKRLFIIAEGYEKILKFEKAIEVYQQILQAAIYMNTKIIRSRTLYNIGRCYEKLSLYMKSLEFYQQCYDFRKKIYKTESRRIGEVLNALGIAHNKLGNQQEAKNYYEQSLQIAQNIYGQNHIIIANMYNNLGSLYFSLQQYSKSAQNFEQAILILKKLNLESQTQETLTNLSVTHKLFIIFIKMLYLEQGQYEQSESCLKLAMEIVKKYEGEDNYKLINIYIKLGTLNSEQKKQGDADSDIKDRQLKSINYYQSALELCIKYYGQSYHQLGEIYNLMGISYQIIHEYDQSLYYLLKSENVLEESKNQNFLWQTYSSLGILFNMQKLYDKSIEYFKKSLEIHNQIDFDNLKKADLMYNIGVVYFYQNNNADSMYWLQKSLTLYKQQEETHPNEAMINKLLSKLQKITELE